MTKKDAFWFWLVLVVIGTAFVIWHDLDRGIGVFTAIKWNLGDVGMVLLVSALVVGGTALLRRWLGRD
ncbi:MAG: hypothetical protein GX483_00515 [Actinomycetaceae bacterium]|nr:hypothetical protein [Actinomycetaceae bacterium]